MDEQYIDSIKVPEHAYFPVDIGQIHLWEKENNMKINVFVLDESENIKIEYHSHIKNKNVVIFYYIMNIMFGLKV